MIARVPGFQLSGGGRGERGFGQATLNLVIDGRRPSSKSSDARSLLQRIPAAQVKHIDIVDGTTLDIPGLTGQVANITTYQTETLSGNWRYAARFEEGTQPQLGEWLISLSGSRGSLSYVATLENNTRYLTETGIERFTDGDNQVFEDRNEKLFRNVNRPKLSLNLTWDPGTEHIANLNFSVDRLNLQGANQEKFFALNSNGRTGESIFDTGEDEFEYEIGGDYTQPVPGIFSDEATLKLIALHRFENSQSLSRFQDVLNTGDTYSSEFENDQDEAEYVLRSEYGWSSSSGRDWQFALEGAFNYLENESLFSDSNTPLTPDAVRVEEKRAQASLTHNRTINERLSLQTSIGAEYSELSVPTNAQDARTFLRPKGFVSASYALSDRYQLVGRVSRVVEQLNFGTFVSSVNLTDAIANTGNEEIVPTQYWDAELELERVDAGALSGTVSAFIRKIEDPIDRVRFADGSEGPGNLESATLYGISVNGTLQTDGLGLPGGELKLESSLSDSDIEDPVTRASRRISSTRLWDIEASLRQDIPNTDFAWEIGIDQRYNSEFFRLDEISIGNSNMPFHFLNLTHKDFFGMQLDIQIQNFFGFEVQRDRTIFDGDRTGDTIQRQTFVRERGRRIGIRLSDSF